MDSIDLIRRKQRMLKELAREERIDFKWHEAGISHVEGILSRGDRRLADVIEHAWRAGARFDGWDDQFDLGRWEAALAACGIDREPYLATRPVDGRLPWDHLDVGLKEGFLAWEYRRALKDRLSQPCGKPNKTLLHHSNLEDAEADQRKLVCYDCGIACDLTEMREERIVYLKKLDAHKREAPAAPRPLPEAPRARSEQPRPTGFQQGEGARFRLKFGKLGRSAFIAHLDTMRLLIRMFRRAGIELIYSKGFHPKPLFTFAPALGLGIASLSELCDVRVAWDGDGESLLARLRPAAPEGLLLEAARRLDDGEPALSKVLAFGDYAAWLPGTLAADSLRTENLTVTRMRKGERKTIDVGRHLVSARVASSPIAEALDWPEGGTVLTWRMSLGDDGSARPAEVIEALTGAPPPDGIRYARLALWSGTDSDPQDPIGGHVPAGNAAESLSA